MKKVAIIMGSSSDYPTMKNTIIILEEFNITYEVKIISAHRTPDLMSEFAKQASTKYSLIIAAAGGAAHLPGMTASLTTLPVIGVPIKSKSLNGVDSLLSIVQMPHGIPVATMAIGAAGASNAALLAIRILALNNPKINEQLILYQKSLKDKVADMQNDINAIK